MRLGDIINMSTLPPIQFTGHGIDMTDVLKDFATNKFSRLAKHAAQIISIHVILNVDKLQQIAEAKLHIPHKEFYAKADSEDMYKTIDLLVDKLIGQMDKHKGKIENNSYRK